MTDLSIIRSSLDKHTADAKVYLAILPEDRTPKQAAALITNLLSALGSATELIAGIQALTGPAVVPPTPAAGGCFHYEDWQARLEAARTAAGIDPAGGPGTDQGSLKTALDAADPSGKLYADAVNGHQFGFPAEVSVIAGDEAAPSSALPISLFTCSSWLFENTPTGRCYIAIKDGVIIANVPPGDLDLPALDAQYGIG